jgi:hypothetical protein
MLRDRDSAWAVALTGSACAAAGAVHFLPPGSPWRLAVVLWFLTCCPGMAVVRLLRLEQLALWVLAVATSLALDLVVAAVMMYAGLWDPPSAVLCLALITTALAWVPAATEHRRHVGRHLVGPRAGGW